MKKFAPAALILSLLIAPTAALGSNRADEIIVRWERSAGAIEKRSGRAAANSKIVEKLPLVSGLEVIEAKNKREALATLRETDGVLYAEPNIKRKPLVTPNDPFFSLQWGLSNTGQTINGSVGVSGADGNLPPAWDRGVQGETVAVIDSGAELNHPDLNIWANPGETPGNGIDDDNNGYIDDVNGWNFINENNNVNDTDGHGTHVAGIIAARGNNGIGVSGVAWNATIVPLKACAETCFVSDTVQALQYAVANGFKISNNSYGGAGASQAEEDAIIAARNAGHLFVAAAGNDSLSNDNSPSYPASYSVSNIISVAASNNKDQLSSFSNYGAESVDLAAPGSDIASTYIDSDYVYASGTSMASPFVAGTAALIKSLKPEAGFADIKNQLLETTRQVPALSGKTVTGGVLNAGAATDITLNKPTITGAPGQKSNERDPSFSFQGIGPFVCQLNDEPVFSCSSPTAFSGLDDGSHSFTVWETDGVSVSEPASFSWQIKTTKPKGVIITKNPPSLGNSSSPGIYFSATEDAFCAVDSGTAFQCSSPLILTNPSDGSKTVKIWQQDEFGNISGIKTIKFTIDRTKPVIKKANARKSGKRFSLSWRGADRHKITAIRVSSDRNHKGYKTFTATNPLKVSARPRFLKIKDAAGNWSNWRKIN